MRTRIDSLPRNDCHDLPITLFSLFPALFGGKLNFAVFQDKLQHTIDIRSIEYLFDVFRLLTFALFGILIDFFRYKDVFQVWLSSFPVGICCLRIDIHLKALTFLFV